MDEKLIRGRSKITGNPRPELGMLTEGAEYDVPEHLFDKKIFDRVKVKKGAKGGGN